MAALTLSDLAGAPGRAAILEALGAIGRTADVAIEIGAAGLLLAALDRPGVALDRYRDHLEGMAGELADALPAAAEAPELAAEILAEIVHRRHGYAGDQLTYDDPQNANLMRVIDRRKGLPVALGILYMQAARRCGLALDGTAFPGHFLLALVQSGRRVLIDPFNAGRAVGASEMRRLIKSMQGDAVELSPAHHQVVSTRAVLLRLQNNIKIRALQARDLARAGAVLEAMTALAPDDAPLRIEQGEVQAAAGNLGAAIAAFEAAAGLTADPALQRQLAEAVSGLRRRLN